MQGTYTAMVTPFDKEGHLDLEGLKQNLHYQIEQGIDGLVILGTTGEAPTLTCQEKKSVIEASVQEVNGRIPLYVGTGSYSTQQAIENTQMAQELGANGALLVTPYYNKPSQEGLYRHFKTVAEAVPLFPIVLYNIQGRTGQNLQTSTLRRLLEIPSILGVKEASGNIAQIGEVIECVQHDRPEFTVLSGDDNLTLAIIALGGNGVVSVASNLVPQLVKSLVKAAQEGDFSSARQIHYQLMPLFRGAFIDTNPIPIKAAMEMCGLPAGPCRLPLCELNGENAQVLRHVVQQYVGNDMSYAIRPR